MPAHPLALERIHDYLQATGHGGDADGPLFRPLKNPAGQGRTDRPLTHGAVYHRVLRKHARRQGLTERASAGPHALRATAATNALDRGADLGKVQEWLGHANVSTTRLYKHPLPMNSNRIKLLLPPERPCRWSWQNGAGRVAALVITIGSQRDPCLPEAGDLEAQRRRLHRAQLLLSVADHAPSIGEVAAECGFADQTHLGRRFRRAHGVSPLAFRRAQQEKSASRVENGASAS